MTSQPSPERVEQAARVLLNADWWWEGADENVSTEVRRRRDAARDDGFAVLAAAGVGELEAEAKRLDVANAALRLSRNDWTIRAHAAEAEVGKMHEALGPLLNVGPVDPEGNYPGTPSFRARMAAAERDALAATVARVEALIRGWDLSGPPRSIPTATDHVMAHAAASVRAAIHERDGAALHPEKGTDDE